MVRYLVLGTVAAGLAIFFWGVFSHVALPLPEPVHRFKDEKAVMDVVRAQTNGNGVYLDPRGVFVALSLRPDMADKSQTMGAYLGVECLTNLAQAFLLAVILIKVRRTSVPGYGAFGLLLGLLAWVGINVSYWNWYGFSGQLIAYDLADMPPGCALGAMVLGWMLRKWKLA